MARRSCLDSAHAACLLGWTVCVRVPFAEGVDGTVQALAEARAR
ncbi:MAG: hypothetical protein OXB97_03660 [Rhodospirillales bacterium]|nr:hypothetical protein [Rhodospirillales bacterium]